MPFFRQRLVADTLVAGVVGILVRAGHAFPGDEIGIVVIPDPLLFHEITQDLDVAVALLFGRKDVVVRYDHHPFRIPDPRGLPLGTKGFPKDADGARAAYVMGHQHVDVDPDVLARRDGVLAGMGCENFFCHGHGMGHGKTPVFSTAYAAGNPSWQADDRSSAWV